MRINKFLAGAGVASRRKADDIIKSGRVFVNGERVTEMGVDIDPDFDRVEIDGVPVMLSEKKYYILLNKPKGYITTTKDQFGRASVTDLTQDISTRIYPVGRLDYNTSGLLIMTNDGDFANMITHPKNKIYKTYIARVKGFPTVEAIHSLRRGVELDDGITAPAKVEVIKSYPTGVDIKISIYEGRNRQVRRMVEAIGLTVAELKRISVGSILLGHVPEGKWRHLTEREIETLRRESK